MFGLETKEKKLFEFDLEADLRKDPAKLKQLQQQTEQKIAQIKDVLRKGSAGKDFEDYGTLLHGLTAFQRILGRINKPVSPTKK